MSMNIPVLPIAGSALVRGLASVLAPVAYWLKNLARAQRHRRQARQLAGLDRHMPVSYTHLTLPTNREV